ncbi:hypothetical protein VHEMI10342 [[Torrubiella] hemipterigena]|uniref:Anucleate primary sterigmata protein B n=1 Tax=[Torrubiella] hemipterigena TaxID=1531966 RepID=A0A0A1TS03_9HYPO|nr:hypothetical protein VHEMI10342 [[Torrubiella] hemipterigena]
MADSNDTLQSKHAFSPLNLRSDKENATAEPIFPMNPPTQSSPRKQQAPTSAANEGAIHAAPLSHAGASHHPADDSLLDMPHIDTSTFVDQTISEEAVRQHFQDVESSFLPTLSPIPTGTTGPNPGADDTFLFDSPQKTDPKQSSDADTTLASQTISNLENLDSSPTAAAAARTISRAVSMASTAARNTTQYDETGVDTQGDSFVSNGGSFDGRLGSSNAQSDMLDAGNTPGFGLRTRRPKYVRSRFASQRSSTSSFITNPESQEGSDATASFDVDFALQTGGAMPSFGASRQVSNPMPRSISIGSMASGLGIDDYADNNGRHLGTVREVESPSRGRSTEDLLKTPKPSRDNLNAPTDTVIAQHVKNVHVPESMAKEFKFKNNLETPYKPASLSSAGTTSRAGKNLTLKEQSSTIERLSKENFDLKLKVMFLSDRLDKLSEEGIKEMISENVELKTNLAVLQRDNKMLRKRVKELEKKIKDDEERPNTSQSATSSGGHTVKMSEEEAYEREQELLFLRERVEEYAIEVERLRSESLARESEKRSLTDIVKSLSERAGEHTQRDVDVDTLNELLQQEERFRSAAEHSNDLLREEVFQLKKELAGLQTSTPHTTNIFNIRKQREKSGPGSRSSSRVSGDGSHANFSAANTLVDELRREAEHLRRENSDLRRENSAQVSMLASRHREKEHLSEQIEELKMRRGDGAMSTTTDSILERSASRAGVRDMSPTRSGAGGVPVFDDNDREELENKVAELRDKINEITLEKQEMQREFDHFAAEYDSMAHGKQVAEDAFTDVQEELQDLRAKAEQLQLEHEEALRELHDMELEVQRIEREADNDFEVVQLEFDHKDETIQQLETDLAIRDEDMQALQGEMRKMSESVVRLEDAKAYNERLIVQREQELDVSNKEVEDAERKLTEANDKNKRLNIQLESSQSEVSFLRDEQESDKVRIGELEAAIANTEQSLRDEKERVRELDDRLQGERVQRELVATKEKEDVQQFVNELNREASAAKDEAKRLRKNLSAREIEATEWKERLMELENNLREALGDLNGTRSSLLKSIANLQRELESTLRELDSTKASMSEKERIITQRDALLESHALETKKMNDALEKERGAHKATKTQFETFQKTHQHLSKTATNQDSRIAELESTRGQERRKLLSLEQTARDQLAERNELLLILWRRLSTLCGREWANSHALVDKQVLPSLEVIASRLPGFSKNLLAAVKAIELMLGSFEAKIKSVERDLTREYQALESNLDLRTKKLDRLEIMVRSTAAAGSLSQDGRQRMQRLEDAYRQLKVENATLRTANDVRLRASQPGRESGRLSSNGSPAPSIHRGPIDKDKGSLTKSQTDVALSNSESSNAGNDNRWLLRLRDMEYKLKMEREGRNQDRQAARQRLGGLETENKELRDRVRRSGSTGE